MNIQHTISQLYRAATLLVIAVLPLTVQGDTDFDHFSTGFPLTGAHRLVDCALCHIGGVFKGTQTRCFSCHDRSSRSGAEYKGLDHINSSNLCDDCHITQSWSIVRRVEHSAVLGSCFSCHNGRISTGKPRDHVQSSNDCDNCHTTFTWFNARFHHENVTGNCVICHNNVIAVGKQPTHLTTANVCESCHRFTSWIPFRVDHNEVIGACFSCHNNSTAVGKPVNHIPSGNDCESCHTTNAWTPATQ